MIPQQTVECYVCGEPTENEDGFCSDTCYSEYVSEMYDHDHGGEA